MILTAYRIFEDLEKNDQVYIFNILEDFPQIKDEDVNEAIVKLVEKNLLTFVDHKTVKPHARRCLAAFQIVKKEPTVNRAFNRSRDMISKKGTN